MLVLENTELVQEDGIVLRGVESAWRRYLPRARALQTVPRRRRRATFLLACDCRRPGMVPCFGPVFRVLGLLRKDTRVAP